VECVGCGQGTRSEMERVRVCVVLDVLAICIERETKRQTMLSKPGRRALLIQPGFLPDWPFILLQRGSPKDKRRQAQHGARSAKSKSSGALWLPSFPRRPTNCSGDRATDPLPTHGGICV
jgi:hypothetical protein